MFELVKLDNAQIVVRHKAEGHAYIYHLPADPTLPLSEAPSIRPNDVSEYDFEDFIEAAYEFARAEAKNAGVAS